MAFTGIVVLVEAGAWHPAQEEEALHNLPMTVGLGEVQELAEAAIHTTSARLEVVRDAEADLGAVIHRTAARQAEARGAEADLEAVIHRTAARQAEARGAAAALVGEIHTTAVRLVEARVAETDLEVAIHTMAGQLGVARAEEDLEAAIHRTAVQQLVEVACHAEAVGLRIHLGVEAGAAHRIPAVAVGQAAEGHGTPAVAAGVVRRVHAVAVGPADHAYPFHPVLPEEDELQMVQDLQGC
jgi:hypothetical protein